MMNPRREPATISCQWSVDEETCISFVNRSTKNSALTSIIHGSGDGDECGSKQREKRYPSLVLMRISIQLCFFLFNI